MPCIHMGNGVICCTRERRRRCAYCRAWAVAPCDRPAPARESGTCDRPLRPRHRRVAGPGRDHCFNHQEDTVYDTPSGGTPAGDDFGDVDRMGDGYAARPSRPPGVEALDDGTLDMEVVAAELAKTPESGESIFRLLLKALTGPQAGLVVERPTFFRRQESVDYLGGDLLLLGVERPPGQPLSQFLAEAGRKLRGRRLSATKSHEDKPAGPGVAAKTYHNLRINGPVAGRPMPADRPAAPSPAPQRQPEPPRQPQPAGAGGDDGSIPF